MINQEELYQKVFKEKWSDILNLLYTYREDIHADVMLRQASTIFEQEFFKKVGDYPTDRKDISNNLDILYILNHGKFYKLSMDNYKKLIFELVKRKPLKEAVNYARLFPDEDICKTKIIEFETLENEKKIKMYSELTPEKWIEIFNRLFELINNQGDTATYFSGPRFINTVKEFEPYFPDYSQFIEQRNREGKSTSRKIYYYDILTGLKEDTKQKVINRFLEILKPFQTEKVNKIEELLGKEGTSKKGTASSNVQKTLLNNPIVFISYSWDDDFHKAWVLNLADRLCSDGIDVILDRYYLKPGKNLPYFVEDSILKAERIIIVFTPNYKLKADKRAGGVGYEYSIINAELYNNQTTNDKIIPVLRAGNKEESIPTFMQQFIHIDTRNNENFENSYLDLIREIYNEPAIQKPKIGIKPVFKNLKSEEIEKPEIGDRIDSITN